MQPSRQLSGSDSSQDLREAPTGTSMPAGAGPGDGQPGGPAARLLAYARTHRKTLAAAAAVTLATGYAAMHALQIHRTRRRVEQALESYVQAQAELEAAEARGRLDFGRKKTPLERAEETF